MPTVKSIDKELVSREGLAEFMKLAWPILEPTRPLQWNWHLDADCDHAAAVLNGDIQRLLVTVPPGTNKSLLFSVFLPAYDWIGTPSRRSIFASYSSTLSIRDSVRCRRIIESPWYQERWGDSFKLTSDQNTKMKFENDKTGFRYAASVGGTVTGDRGDIVVSDDLINVKEAESEAHRTEASKFFWEVLPSRVNDLETARFIVIMQRSHSSDTAGEILKRSPGRWEHLNLPLEYEPGAAKVTSIGFKDPRTKKNEVLHPERFSDKVIAGLKEDLGSYAYAGQYQQRPTPREGGMVKEAWLGKRFKADLTSEELRKREGFVSAFQSADTASKAKEKNDPTVIGTFGEFMDGHLELWDVKRKRMEFTEGKRTFKDGFSKWTPNYCIIEDKDSGQQYIQQLGEETKTPIKAVNPGTLDKVTRMAAETPFLESLKLWLPENAPWLADFITELTTFPSSEKKDQADMISQALKYHREKKEGQIPPPPAGDAPGSIHSPDQ